MWVPLNLFRSFLPDVAYGPYLDHGRFDIRTKNQMQQTPTSVQNPEFPPSSQIQALPSLRSLSKLRDKLNRENAPTKGTHPRVQFIRLVWPQHVLTRCLACSYLESQEFASCSRAVLDCLRAWCRVAFSGPHSCDALTYVCLVWSAHS